MNKAEVKKEMDRFINKEPWMTPQLARKMTTSKRKRKRWQPIFALVCIAALCLVIVITGREVPLKQQATNSLEQIVETMDNPILSAIVLDYLQALETKNAEALDTLSNGYFVGNVADKLLDRYQSIDFATLQVLHMSPSKGEPAFTVYMTAYDIAERKTMLFTGEIVQSNEDYYVSENLDMPPIIYEPYVPKQTIALNYEKAPNGFENDNLAYFEPATEPMPMPSGDTLHFYKQSNYLTLAILQQQHRYVVIGYMEASEDVYITPIIDDTFYLIQNDTNTSGLLFYKRGGNVQIFEIVSPINYVHAEQGVATLIFDRFIVHTEGGELQYSFLQEEQEWQQNFISTSAVDNGLHIVYEDLTRAVSAYYELDDSLQLQLTSVTEIERNK